MKDSFYFNDINNEKIYDNQSNCFAILMKKGRGIVITNNKLFAWNGMTEKQAETVASSISRNQ